MLQVTTRAAMVLKEARSQRGLPEHFGLRVESRASDARGRIRLEFTAEPVEGDEVGGTDGLPLFVSRDLAEPLAEQAIDMRDTASGSDLVLRDQRVSDRREGLT